MEFDTVIKERYSVRKYKPDCITDDELNTILKAGMVAPTGCNYQPQRIYVLKSSEAIAKIRKLTPCAFNAPVVLMVTVAEEEQWTNDLEKGFAAGQVDVGIIGTHLMLEAAEQGLGSCWVAHFPPRSTAEAFGLSRHETPIMLLPLGYPADGVVPSPSHALRKSLGELVKEF